MKKKKRPITLIELMVVIVIIGLIASVIGYNMKGSLDKGKAFKTEQAMNRVKDLLYLAASEQNEDISKVVAKPEKYLEKTGMLRDKDISELLKDGWGKRLDIKLDGEEIVITSTGLEAYRNRKG
jgi:prepilin-type N-terminal cleavage/methylation domain-containing protein